MTKGTPARTNASGRVSVLLTVFNGMPYLKEAVNSILRQSLQDFDFIVIDNGSSDESGRFLDSLTDSRLQLIHLPQTIARTEVLNLGLAMVQTEFTAIIDADDIALPERLKRQRAFLLDNPGIALVGSSVAYIDPQGKVLSTDIFPTEHDALCEKLAVYNQFAHAAVMYRTNAAREVGGYPEEYRYAQDFALWLAMLYKSYKVASIPEILAQIRMHPKQTTHSAEMLETRHQEHIALAHLVAGIPGISQRGKQAALVRKAAVYAQKKDFGNALASAVQAFLTAPLTFFVNSLLWERLTVAVKRKVKRP